MNCVLPMSRRCANSFVAKRTGRCAFTIPRRRSKRTSEFGREGWPMSPLEIPQRVGGATLEALRGLGHNARFFVELMKSLPPAVRRFFLVIAQIHAIGNYSLVIIVASGLAVGFVLGLQGYYTLSRYGAAESLGLLVALSLVRELGPVVTALLFAGRAGTSLTAEIGLMKAGEQLAAMEMMAIDPKQRVLAPRFVGGIIAMPLLAAMFSAVGIFGGYIVGVLKIGIDAGQFW